LGPDRFWDIVLFRFSTLKILQLEDIILESNRPTCWGTTDFLLGFTPKAI
jgi:hypothetical protein